MPYDNQEQSIDADAKRQLGAKFDELVANGTLTPEQALVSAQEAGLTTGPGAYQPVGYQAAQDATVNEQSRQSAAQSAAYQASRAGNPEGYTQESQDAWNLAHPLSDY